MKNLNRHLTKTENSQTQKLGGKKMKAKKLILGLVALSISLSSILSFAASVSAEIPQMINYQGVLTDSVGCPVEDGNYTMIFRIYDAPTDGNLLWDETHDAVTVTQGNFNVLLGSTDSIPNSIFLSDSLWLAVKVGNDPEMTPRQRIASVGYAFRSDFADTAEYARTGAPDNDWVIDGDNIYREQGNVGIGTTEPNYKLVLQTGLNNLSLDPDVAGEQNIVAKGQMALQAGAGNDIVFRDGNTIPGAENVRILGNGNVGIGTTEPDEKLEVDGNAHITGDLTVDGNINPAAECWRHSGAQVFSGTAPSTWTDLDLSGYVGSNHALIILKIKKNSGGSYTAVFRPNGDSDEYWRCSDLSDMGAQGHKGECGEAGIIVVETDVSGIIEWRGGADVTLTLLGYVK